MHYLSLIALTAAIYIKFFQALASSFLQLNRNSGPTFFRQPFHLFHAAAIICADCHSRLISTFTLFSAHHHHRRSIHSVSALVPIQPYLSTFWTPTLLLSQQPLITDNIHTLAFNSPLHTAQVRFMPYSSSFSPLASVPALFTGPAQPCHRPDTALTNLEFKFLSTGVVVWN